MRSAGDRQSQVARPLKLPVNPLLCPMRGHAHEVRFGFARLDGFPDTETPFPKARFRFNNSEFDTLPDHLHVPDSFARISKRSVQLVIKTEQLVNYF